MEKKLTKKQIENIKKFRKDNPKETTHQRRAKIIKEQAWWIPRD